MRFVVDTNVPIVANGRSDPSRGSQQPSNMCRRKSIEFLERLVRKGRVVIDREGEIIEEYRKHLRPSGQPGVGDRFYQVVLLQVKRVERHPLPRDKNNAFIDFPKEPDLASFDPSDRKFAALARRAKVPVANATDSDWLHYREPLARHGIRVCFLCGYDTRDWFEG